MTSQPALNPTFEIIFPGQDAAQDLFGLWDIKPAGSPVASSEQNRIVWRAILPADPLASADMLNAHAWKQSLFDQALPLVEKSLQSDLAGISSGSQKLSYSLSEASPAALETPRAALLVAARYYRPELSYGLLDGLLDRIKIGPKEWGDTQGAITRFIGMVNRSVQEIGRVETFAGSQKLGLTHLDWSGGLETYWGTEGDVENFNLHNQVLSQALHTRQQWLKVILLFNAGIAGLAASLAVAPFSPVVLWATWNYIKRMVTEFQTLSDQVRNPQ